MKKFCLFKGYLYIYIIKQKQKVMAMQKEEFKNKYGFNKPESIRDRDRIIFSNLSDVQEVLSFDPAEARQLIDNLKHFIWDTEDVKF